MITFTEQNNNSQFISIYVKDGVPTDQLCDYICNLNDNISLGLFKMDDEEIILNIGGENGYGGLSLSELNNAINKVADADISTFYVDTDEPDQRRGIHIVGTRMYEVEVTETFARSINVYAQNEEEAIEKAREAYEMGGVEFMYDLDCVDIRFNV